MNFENIFPFRNMHSIYDINILMDYRRHHFIILTSYKLSLIFTLLLNFISISYYCLYNFF